MTAWKFSAPEGAGDAMETLEMHDTSKAGALGGGFWGLLFLVPLIGLAIGAASALMGSLTDAGISDTFIKDVCEKVTPGSSALFALTSHAVRDKVAEAFWGTQAELISTNLSLSRKPRSSMPSATRPERATNRLLRG